MAPVYDELGEHFEDDKTIVVAKMDATANEVEEVDVRGFPTLVLFKKDTNEVVHYNGESYSIRWSQELKLISLEMNLPGPRELESMVKFLESGGKPAVDDEEEDEAKGDGEAKHTEL